MGKRIPQHKIDEIFAAADVVEILGEYLQMKKRGSNFFALSPFTNEKTPSFAISPTKNIWKDFATGKGGNAVSFLMEAEGMNYVEALKHIAAKYHIELDLEESPEDFARQDVRESLYVLNAFASRYFHKEMMETESGKAIAHSYFKERGVLDSTMEQFELGYCADEWEKFSKEAIRNQYKEEYLVKTGLSFKSDKTDRLVDRFRGRIMFPIHNHLGKVVGFGGRVMGSGKMAKYINSPESEIYHKSNVLYGLYQGKSAIRDLDRCILVEGYMDVISLAQAGILNVVASSGTALTVEQIRLIKRFSKNVLLIYDADRAGIAAALRGMELLLEAEVAVRVLLLPEGEDPDSYVKEHGKSGFDKFVDENALDFLDFKLARLKVELNFDDPQEKTRAIHEVAQLIARIPDQVKLAVYLSEAAEKLGMPASVIQQSLNKALSEKAKLESRQKGFKQKQAQQTIPTTSPKTESSPDNEYYDIPIEAMIPQEELAPELVAQEEELLRLLLNYPEQDLDMGDDEFMPLAEYMQMHISEVKFSSPILEKFKTMLFEDLEKNGNLDINRFINHEEQSIAKVASSMLTIPFEVSENWEKFGIKAQNVDDDLAAAVNSSLAHFQMQHLRRLIEECRMKLKEAKDGPEMDALMKKYSMLTKLRKEITDNLGIVILEYGL